VRGVLGVHVDAETAAIDLAGADLHQLLRRDRQRRVSEHLARRDDVPAEPSCDRVAEEIQASIHGALLRRSYEGGLAGVPGRVLLMSGHGRHSLLVIGHGRGLVYGGWLRGGQERR
jgi:hypothetical protein